jgi:hypothetical protein
MTRARTGSVRRLGLVAVLGTVLTACAAQPEKPGKAAPRITSVPPSFDANDLPGLDGDNVARLLGSPGLLRHDGIAQVWQYVDEACILDLFLYDNGGRHVVEYVEARSSREIEGTAPSVQTCLDAILRDRQPLTS